MVWQTKKLGEVLEYEQPTAYIVSSKKYRDDYETPVLTAGKSFILGKTKEKEGVFPAKDLPVIIFDDFTTATKFVDFPFKVKSSAMKILRPVKDVSDAKFLFYMIQNISFDHTGIHKRYWISEYSKIEVPLPSISEQKRVVKKLDEVFEEVTKAKEAAGKNLQNAKELFGSYLQSVFANPGKDWEEKNLNEISENLDSKRVPITKRVRSSGKYPYYGASGVVDYVGEYIFDDDLLLVSEDGANLLARTYPIAFSISGRSWVNNHAHVLKFEKIESQRFVEYYLNSIKLDPYVSGMAQPKLNQKMLNSIPVPYPSFSEQKDIVKKLDALSAKTKKLEKMYERKIVGLEELKKSVLKRAFSGEL